MPDDLKSGVHRPSRYEPDLNPSYQDFAEQYRVAILPARVRKPRDKAKVEVGVQGVERWIMAPLRHRTFFSLSELNAALREGVRSLQSSWGIEMPQESALLALALKGQQGSLRVLHGALFVVVVRPGRVR